MPKHICILTSNEENFFTPPILADLSVNLKNEISYIVFVPGFTSIKRQLCFLLLLKFGEIVEILYHNLKYYFKKRKDNYNEIRTKIIKNINSDESIKFLSENNFDIIVTLNCSQIIEKKTLDQVPSGFVNFHPGKLPNYRGLFTNFYSLLNKENEIHFSFHIINDGIDTGPLMRELVYLIEKEDTVFSLYKKIYLDKRSHSFIIDCIKNYKLYKNNLISKSDEMNFAYHSYPTIKQIIRFFLKT